MGDRSGMLISADSLSDETLNQGPLALLLRRQYEFTPEIDIAQFSVVSPLDETLNRGLLALLLCDSMNFPLRLI